MLDNQAIRSLAPSVFAGERGPKMTDKYGFISTAQVLDALCEEGFQPVRAKQAGSRETTPSGYVRHVITFRLPDAPLVAGEYHPEIVVMNAHDGSAAYRLMIGVFRVVCANGLVVADSTLASIRVAHVGARTITEVVAATYQLVGALPTVMAQIDAWRSVMLTRTAQIGYARAALSQRYPKQIAPINPEQLLDIRRNEDGDRDLWTVYNRVQEHLVRGGLVGQARREVGGEVRLGRRSTTRPLAGVRTSLDLNRGLWALTERAAAGEIIDQD